MKIKSFHKISAVIFALALPGVIFAMSSSSYSIPSDSVNVGGLSNSSSASYNQSDTVGEQATGDSSSASYAMHAGFQQMQDSYIAISYGGGTLPLSSIGGISGGSTSGSDAWNVTTDNGAGYSLSIKATSTPALQSANDSFADYAPAGGATPDFAFSVGAASSTFGFSPEGTDIASLYKDNGAACNTGALDTANACWDGFTTSNKIISQTSASNQPLGATTTVKFRAAVGSNRIQTAGSYSATITVTAVTL